MKKMKSQECHRLKKHNKLVNITKKKQIHKSRELVVTREEREEERGKIGVGE